MLVLVVLATISGALSFQWTSSNILANGTVVQVCDGDNLTLNWTFNLTSSEQLQLMEWRRSFQGKRTSLAIYHDEEFFKKPEGERVGVEFLPNAGLFLPSVTVSDSGYYEVLLSVLDPPRVYMYSQTALLQVSVTPATIDGSLHAYILPVGDFQAITGTWHVQLGCGKFLSLGHPTVNVVWNTPSKQTVNSTSFTNNTFILTLANPVEEGDYSCLLERMSPVVECIDSHSPLRHIATVRVHGINTRLSLIEGCLEALREETINLSRSVKDLLDVVSKVDVKVTLNKTGAARRPVSCTDVQKFDNKSGVHTLYLNNFTTINVFCDQQTDNGGWTVIQRRQDGSVDFYRKWEDYEVGFGNLTGEFWIGLSQLYQLTKDQKHRLRVDLTDFDGSTVYAVNDKFYISGAAFNYTLLVHGYRGNAGDSLKVHNLNQFTTYDRDNDKANSSNCARDYHGAWWYEACNYSNLNGRYKSDGAVGSDGVTWAHWKNDNRSYKRVEMKIKS